MTAAKPDIAPFDGVWTSALAAELAAVPQRVRTAVGLPDTAIQLLEMVVRGCRILLDDNDPRSLVDRVEDLEPMLDALVGGDAGHAQLDRFTQWSEQQVKDKLEHWVNRLRSPAGQAFLRRVMGTGRYDRIRQALTDDGALVMVASRRLLWYMLPLAQAFLDATAALPAESRAQYPSLPGFDRAVLQMAVELDEMIDGFAERQGMHLDVPGLPMRPDEVTRLAPDVEQLTLTIRAALRAETEEKVTELSGLLGRKLRGFEQALSYSDDGVSQAANSLIEFIDRLLRQAFDECYVLQWASTHFPGEDRMTHVDVVNVVHPTTFARALCFVCAGDAPNEPYEPARMLADSLVSVRRAAEKLKHANADEATEVNTLRNLMAAVRGVMTFVMRFTWGLAHEERLDYLRRRFAIAS